MAQSSEAIPFDMSEDTVSQPDLDNTCPECGVEAIASYLDRYSQYEYCTNCDWSDEDEGKDSWEPMARKDRLRDEA